MLLLVIVFGLIDGCPLPPRGQTPAWEKAFVEPIRTVQQAALRPVAWIRPLLRASQRWSLYQAPSVERFRLWVEGEDRHGRWQVLFRAGDPDHQAEASLIDYSRPRGAWDPTTGPPEQYPLFARWMVTHVLDTHPDYVAARVRLEKVHLTPDGPMPSGEFVFPHIELRGAP